MAELVTAKEFAEVRGVAAGAALTAEEAMALSRGTHEMVRDLHRALIEPQAGHEKGLLDRMATATIAWEQGGATGDAVIRAAKIIGAASAIAAALAGALHFLQGVGVPK